MPKTSRASKFFLVNTVIVALLWVGALFAFAGSTDGFLSQLLGALRWAGQDGIRSANALMGDAPAGVPAIRPDMAGRLGVNLEQAGLDVARLPGTLQRLEAAGITWLRIGLPWNELEPERGRYDWGAWDALFAALARHPQLQVVLVLDGSPAWARDPMDVHNPAAPPHDRTDFGAYAGAVARRYGEQIRYYQIWHEPNIAPHWGARPVDPLGYMGLLREGAVQIRTADPDAQILLAALAPNVEGGGANMSDVLFLDALYGHGAGSWFDIVAAQPFGFEQPPDATAAPGTLNFARVSLLREVMVRHVDATSPIWATAFGWNAPTVPGGPQPAPWGHVTAQDQARYTAAAIELAQTRWPWLGVLFWPTYCPERPLNDPINGFTLCPSAEPERPVWTAMVEAARGPVSLPPGDHAPDHPALTYSSGWRVTAAAADPAADAQTLDFDFHGTDLALRVQGGPFWAFYRISVDGRPANALPKESPEAAYLVLHDPSAAMRTVPVATGLAPGTHRVHLESSGGWGQWALQGVLVLLEPRATFGRWQLWAALAALATAAATVTTLHSRPVLPNGAALAGRLQEGLDRVAAVPPPVLWSLAIGLGVALELSRSLLLDLALLGALGLLFLARPSLSLPLIAFSIPFWPQPKPLLRWGFTHYELFLWLGTAGMLGRSALERLAFGGDPSHQTGVAYTAWKAPGAGWPSAFRFRPSLVKMDYPILALLAAGLVSALIAEERAVALREWRSVFLLGTLFYFLVTRMPGPERRVRSWSRLRAAWPLWPVVDGLLLGMVAVSLVALWQLISGQGRIDVEGVWRVRAFYGSPNNLALALDRALPLALAVALFGQGRGRRICYGVAALVMGVACLATFSKGALLLGLPAGIALVLVAGAVRVRRPWPLWLLGVGAVLAAAGLAILFRTPRFAGLLNFQTGTSFFRLKLWEGALQMALDHPWLGVGPDNFLYAYRTHYVLPAAWQELNLSHPHNIVLDFWTRLGVFGTLAGVWAFSAGLIRGWQAYRSDSPVLWPVALGLVAGLIATLAHGLIDNSLFLIDLMALFSLALALLQRLSDTERGTW